VGSSVRAVEGRIASRSAGWEDSGKPGRAVQCPRHYGKET